MQQLIKKYNYIHEIFGISTVVTGPVQVLLTSQLFYEFDPVKGHKHLYNETFVPGKYYVFHVHLVKTQIYKILNTTHCSILKLVKV